MTFPYLKQVKEGIFISIKVTPAAKRSKIVGEENGVLKIHIHAAPEKNGANLELISLLATFFGLSKKDVILIKGSTSRLKVLLLENITMEMCCEKLLENGIQPKYAD
jgi:uncharacterized protein (TIGR00251 family)